MNQGVFLNSLAGVVRSSRGHDMCANMVVANTLHRGSTEFMSGGCP